MDDTKENTDELNKELNKELNADLNKPVDVIEEKVEEDIQKIEKETEEKKEHENKTTENNENEKEEQKINEKKEDAEKNENKLIGQETQKKEKPEKDYFKEEKRIEKLRQLVEATLFMSPQPISLQEIARISGTGDLELISELIEALRKDLIERKSGIEIVRETEGYRMQVLSELEVKVSHLAGPTRFSKGVMKTLAYIAFKQPVKQSTIVKFRTNKAYDEIKILEEQGFISKEKAGITFVIKTTKKFLEYFGDNAIKLIKNPDFE
ncbi:SMC-Scp complex subunit ScpB [Candidatus Micrarchaeota archaeon]|nr:SMC-Scp complex subunit ScpB [Candidatus Micrarchaeota archaeon]